MLAIGKKLDPESVNMYWTGPVLAINVLRSKISELVESSGTMLISSILVKTQTLTDSQILIVSQSLGRLGCFSLSSVLE